LGFLPEDGRFKIFSEKSEVNQPGEPLIAVIERMDGQLKVVVLAAQATKVVI
jgi:hypothetical protein